MNKKLEYKWVILAACFLMVFVCLGFCSSNKGLYLSAITGALGIPRSLFSINDSCRFITTAIINLFFGTLISRFGIRKMAAFGFAALIGSMLIYIFATNILVFYIGGVLLGIGLSFTTTTMASSIIRQWFTKDIGKYTGIVFAANGIGGALAAQIVSPLINEPGNPFGYRKAYLVVTAILVVTGIITLCLLKDGPTENGPAQKKARGASWSGIDYETAKKRPYFYLAAVIVFLTGFILQGVSGAYPAHLKDIGLDPGYVATVASIASLAMTASKILVGALYDRFGLRTVTILCQGSVTVAYVMMAFLNTSAFGKASAVVFALLYALAIPLETLVIPLIVNELFGTASYNKILGIFAAMNYAGYSLGTPLVNLSYDIFGTYSPIFLVLGLLMLPTCAVFQLIITAAQKERGKAMLAAAPTEKPS
ncbi:MAG: MFS transporter [Ruminococcaceae bacterium]|nr:MFS transporter [Oscillospiraceae bacterium]